MIHSACIRRPDLGDLITTGANIEYYPNVFGAKSRPHHGAVGLTLVVPENNAGLRTRERTGL